MFNVRNNDSGPSMSTTTDATMEPSSLPNPVTGTLPGLNGIVLADNGTVLYPGTAPSSSTLMPSAPPASPPPSLRQNRIATLVASAPPRLNGYGFWTSPSPPTLVPAQRRCGPGGCGSTAPPLPSPPLSRRLGCRGLKAVPCQAPPVLVRKAGRVGPGLRQESATASAVSNADSGNEGSGLTGSRMVKYGHQTTTAEASAFSRRNTSPVGRSGTAGYHPLSTITTSTPPPSPQAGSSSDGPKLSSIAENTTHDALLQGRDVDASDKGRRVEGDKSVAGKQRTRNNRSGRRGRKRRARTNSKKVWVLKSTSTPTTTATVTTPPVEEVVPIPAIIVTLDAVIDNDDDDSQVAARQQEQQQQLVYDDDDQHQQVNSELDATGDAPKTEDDVPTLTTSSKAPRRRNRKNKKKRHQLRKIKAREAQEVVENAFISLGQPLTHTATADFVVISPTVNSFTVPNCLTDTSLNSGRLVRNTLRVHHSIKSFDQIRVTDGGAKIRDTPNAGGNSVASEVLSFEMLRCLYGAELKRTEMQLDYFPAGGKITDYSVELYGLHLGVSVTRAMKYGGVFGDEDAIKLLTKKLFGVNESSRLVMKPKFHKQILHIFAEADYVVDVLQRVYDSGALDPQLTGDTLVVVTVAGDKDAPWVFQNLPPIRPTRRMLRQAQKVKLRASLLSAAAMAASAVPSSPQLRQ